MLSAKLDAVLKHLERGKTKQAVNQLRAFINQVADMISNGTLAPEDVPPQVDWAERVIVSLQIGGADMDLTAQDDDSGSDSRFLPMINR